VALATEMDDPSYLAAARLTLAGGLSRATRLLAHAIAVAFEQLEDEETPTDLEDLALVVGRVEAQLRTLLDRVYDGARPNPPDALLAPLAWRHRAGTAVKRLKEAHDLLDDGMPADAVAFELAAARADIEAALTASATD